MLTKALVAETRSKETAAHTNALKVTILINASSKRNAMRLLWLNLASGIFWRGYPPYISLQLFLFCFQFCSAFSVIDG
jgi:hypothetical protein